MFVSLRTLRTPSTSPHRLAQRASSRLACFAALLTLTACREQPPRTAADSQAAHIDSVIAAGGVVDSVLPVAEQLRRFREGLEAPDTLRHAAPSREALVRQFIAAVSKRDTAALNAMVLDRAEFAYLYYPSSVMSRPPYEAPPQLLWGQIMASSNEGLPKVLARASGESIQAGALSCADSVAVEGENRLHQQCTMSLRFGSGAPLTARWFGTIIERDGRFKFIGYANSL